MKIEMDETAAISLVLIVLIVSSTMLGMHGCSQCERTLQVAYSLGMEEQQMYGASSTMMTYRKNRQEVSETEGNIIVQPAK